MARIPLGNFGNAIADPAPRVNIPSAAFDNAGAGLQRLGDAAVNLSGDLMAKQKAEEAALNRARAANAVLDREIATKTAQADVERAVTSGALHYGDAVESYRKRVGALDLPAIAGLDPVTAENVQRSVRRNDQAGEFNLSRMAERFRGADFRGQTDLAIDKLGKLAGIPGADVPAIIKQLDSLEPLARVGYGEQWQAKKQSVADAIWYNDASAKVIAARGDMEGLKQLERALTDQDGFYVSKLDTDKRNMLMRTVITQRQQLEARGEAALQRAERNAEITIGEIDRQISSGIPATPEMWAKWSVDVRGTSQTAAFQERIADEVKVQELLRLPISQQVAEVEARRQQLLTGGGSVRDKANFDRFSTVVNANVKTITEAPLLYLQNRTGDAQQPLDMMAFTNPKGYEQVADTLRERAASIKALQDANPGIRVQMRPFLPAEVANMSNMLREGTVRQQQQVFATLYTAIGDRATYRAAMQQIAPDSPIKAMAGMLMANQRKLTLEDKWFTDDITATSGDVGATMLEGDRILNKSPDQKAEDGRPRNFPVPDETKFKEAFKNYAGRAFAGSANEYLIAAQAVRAYYVGKSAKDGDVSGEVDAQRMKHAVKSVLGEVVDMNGNGEVLAPWGMDASAFKDAARQAFAAEAAKLKLPPAVSANFGALGLRNFGEGTYLITQGRNFLHDTKGQLVTINVLNIPSPQRATGRIRVAP